MSGIPIHTASPINSRRPSATTLETASSNGAQPSYEGAAPTPTSTENCSSYPPAQPGAAAPAPTGTTPAPGAQPEPTKITRQSSVASLSYTPTSATPPPPQPGAAPVPLSAGPPRRPSAVPPPPKVGEEVKPASYYAPQQATPTSPTQYPHYQSPPMPAHQQLGTITTPIRAQPPASTTSTSVQPGGDPGGLNNPPGYVQDSYGAFGDRPVESYNPYAGIGGGEQRGSVSHGILGNSSAYQGSNGSTSGGFSDENQGMAGIWDTAVGWAKTAGQKLQEGEEAVWRMVDKKS